MQDKPPPSPEIAWALRDQAFDEIGRLGVRVESYARSIQEAAFRGDTATVFAHLQELRLCCMSMIKTYKDCLNGQAAAAKGDEVGRGNGAD